MVSAVLVNSSALSASPFLAASSAMVRAVRAWALAFFNSPIRRFKRSSVCFWLAMTLAACSLSRRCWSWLADGLLELDLGIGPGLEVTAELGRQVVPPPAEELDHGREPRGGGRRRPTTGSQALEEVHHLRHPQGVEGYGVDDDTDDDAHHGPDHGPRAGVGANGLAGGPDGNSHDPGSGGHPGDAGHRAPTVQAADPAPQRTEGEHGAEGVGDGVSRRQALDTESTDQREGGDDVHAVLGQVEEERGSGVLEGVEAPQHEEEDREPEQPQREGHQHLGCQLGRRVLLNAPRSSSMATRGRARTM